MAHNLPPRSTIKIVDTSPWTVYLSHSSTGHASSPSPQAPTLLNNVMSARKKVLRRSDSREKLLELQG
ncbi:hypothetical protein GUITHDRAFT_155960 [Guillardia theta CCMP2712]|uniref:Uncharacterized protein n=1 Tax=Guillardia theta (strain CCMP2712) TaxID=905079 RepID=L1IBM7_GUITC|nr:hypothetical protein GUITHDRAFT_155960 [Guillardia theta CCMP2712]EKX33661.1 hypothetical protein GUITHDRAFT_155960 [Guillardia theta CCMP2712]|eukprot:XP_005820641.1 hypothetical protein GUITHDRAFT_155960 [Guillardia theta CCMP2712]